MPFLNVFPALVLRNQVWPFQMGVLHIQAFWWSPLNVVWKLVLGYVEAELMSSESSPASSTQPSLTGAFIYLRTAKFQQTHTSAPRTAVTTRMSSNATLVRELIKCFLLFVIMCMQSLEQVYAYFLSSFWGEKKKTKVNIIGSQEGPLLSKLICSDAIFSFICNRHLPTPLAGN